MHTLATTLTAPRSPAGSAPKPYSKSSQSLSGAYHLRIKCAQNCSRMSHASDTKRVTMEHFETLLRGWRLPDRRHAAAPGTPHGVPAKGDGRPRRRFHPAPASPHGGEEAYQPESPARRERAARGQTGAGSVLESSSKAHPGVSAKGGGAMVACEGMLAGPPANRLIAGRRINSRRIDLHLTAAAEASTVSCRFQHTGRGARTRDR